MIKQQLIDPNTKDILLTELQITESALERMKGLLGSKPLNPEAGLLIKPCNSVHTWFMQYPIDIIYLDQSKTIKKIITALKPWRLSFCLGAKYTLELNQNNAQRLNLKTGQQLQW